MSVGQNIRFYRKMLGWSQGRLGEEIGVSDKTISSWEVDRTEPSMGVIQKLAEIFGCETSDLVNSYDSNIKEPTGEYHFDLEAHKIAKEIAEDPNLRAVFKSLRKTKKEDLEFIKEFIARMKERER
jgi:DNA-binding XRE family transcriptional regulator